MENRIRAILTRLGCFSVPTSRIANHQDLYAIGLTSLATVDLMLSLEREFDVEFPDTALSRRTFSTISCLTAAISRLPGHVS